jgi:hypothetical protein
MPSAVLPVFVTEKVPVVLAPGASLLVFIAVSGLTVMVAEPDFTVEAVVLAVPFQSA